MVAVATQEVVPPVLNSTDWHNASPKLSLAESGRTTFRLASTPTDRFAAFRLAYDKYVQQGMLGPNRYRLRVTDFHLLDTTAVFIAERDEQVVGTATLIADGELGLPLDMVHPEVTRTARSRGLRLGEAAGLAIRSPRRLPDLPIFVGLTRLMAQYARLQMIRQVVVACVPEHAHFYCRYLGFERIGPVRPYPSVCNTLGVACRLDFAHIDRCRPDCYDRYFGTLIPPSELVNSPMSHLEREAFGRVLEHSWQRQRCAA